MTASEIVDLFSITDGGVSLIVLFTAIPQHIHLPDNPRDPSHGDIGDGAQGVAALISRPILRSQSHRFRQTLPISDNIIQILLQFADEAPESIALGFVGQAVDRHVQCEEQGVEGFEAMR